MLEYINSCLDFPMQTIALFPSNLLTGNHITINQNYQPNLVQSEILQSEFDQFRNQSVECIESFVINQNQESQQLQVFEVQEERNLNFENLNQEQKQSRKSLRDQINERLSHKHRNSYIPFQQTSKSPQTRTPPIQKNDDKENMMPTIHRKQFTQINDTNKTPNKYIPFQSKKYNITPSRTSTNASKKAHEPQKHVYQRELKNGISHIKLNLYKQ